MTETTTLNPDMTMEVILQAYPSAQRALFQRYHVGGCSACGFQPTDTLGQVCKDHNLLDVQEVMRHILNSHEADTKMQLPAATVSGWLSDGQEFRFIDVRMPSELEQARLPQAEPLDFENRGAYMQLPKDTRFVFMCKDGQRSLDVAAYFAGHGFEHAYSLSGGLDAWRREVDSSIPDY